MFSSKHVEVIFLSLGLVFVVLNQNTAEAGLESLERVQSGLNRPMFVTHAPNDTERLFIAERDGAIRILNLADDTLEDQDFLSISGLATGGEGGLLGMAFHPEYDTNGKFYVYVTLPSPFRSQIREYTVTQDPDVADPNFTELLSWNQPQPNHNGGWIGFSPNDGYLYIMSGDGGGANDNSDGHTAGSGNAQDITNNLLGKALRIDVDGNSEGNYGNPESNPFVGTTGDDEIWAYGLRNPFRASFDRETGDLWIGDVGQATREEIDFQPAESEGGENYGWRLREGTIATPTPFDDPVGGDPPPDNVEPVYDYAHGFGDFQGNSTVGGYVYRGPDPSLQGTYIFGDTISGNVWSFDPADPNGTVANVLDDLMPDAGSLDGLVSFGEDALGNIYLVDIASSVGNQQPNTGDLFRIVTDQLLSGDFDGDGDVDGDDLSRWQTGYGTSEGAEFSQGDADGNGVVDGSDFLIWQRNFGRTAQDPMPEAAHPPVPEPGSSVLLMLGVITYVISSARVSASSSMRSTLRLADM